LKESSLEVSSEEISKFTQKFLVKVTFVDLTYEVKLTKSSAT
jgi:hypothetical protein